MKKIPNCKYVELDAEENPFCHECEAGSAMYMKEDGSEPKILKRICTKVWDLGEKLTVPYCVKYKTTGVDTIYPQCA